jgi:hypothetical protein
MVASGRFRRRRNAGRHGADHDDENRSKRQHVKNEELVTRPAGLFLDWRRRREIRPRQRADDDVADKRDAQHQARYDAADQELGNRNSRQAAEQDREGGGRNKHVDCADRHDRPGGKDGAVAARQHHRQHQRAQHGRGRNRRSRYRRENRAGDDRNHGETTRHLAYQPLDAIDDIQRQAGMEEHLAHQNEKRDRCQREVDHGRDAVARDLMQAGIAAKKQKCTDQVDRDEGDRDRHAGK